MGPAHLVISFRRYLIQFKTTCPPTYLTHIDIIPISHYLYHSFRPHFNYFTPTIYTEPTILSQGISLRKRLSCPRHRGTADSQYPHGLPPAGPGASNTMDQPSIPRFLPGLAEQALIDARS